VKRISTLSRTVAASMATALAVATLSACAGFGGTGGGKNSINVLMVNNPQMLDIEKLTKANFTKKTGIKVNYTVLPENDVRDKISQELSSQAGIYDVSTISNYEVPFYAKAGWLTSLDPYTASAAKGWDPNQPFDQNDIFSGMTTSLTAADGHLYAEPFYGESSFLMYRKDVFQQKGVTMPDNPTWQQVADLAAKVDHAQPGMRGICLRGQVGWGQVFAPLTTVVNAFGGTWYNQNWQAQVNAAPFKKAVEFYIKLVRSHGEAGAPQAGFTECLTALETGRTAMWYDATSAAGSLESSASPNRGKFGYVQAPTVPGSGVDHTGWLYAWSWAIEHASNKRDAAWKFISWASSRQYEELVGSKLGWANVPAGKRKSTYENQNYLKVASAFAKPTETAIENADPKNAGAQKRPVPGIQFMDFPEFAAMATTVSQYISTAIAGQMSVDTALKKGQSVAQRVGKDYQS
jgi:sorbitol/mannitol transport system substrate-binding protein